MGLRDIQDNCVRSIGDPALRFEEDPVRILRAIKLVGQYGFKMEKENRKGGRRLHGFYRPRIRFAPHTRT